eukprot:scaffold103983_cov39-Cyclotella_meneghiniana.AAC.3
MPQMKLALYFESEIGSGFFEPVMKWHSRSGPIHAKPGFRMPEIFNLLLDFQIPWLNGAVDKPDEYLPDTLCYLQDNFDDNEYNFRRKWLIAGLAAMREKFIDISSRYLFKPPLIFLLLSHRSQEDETDDDGVVVSTAEIMIYDELVREEWGDFNRVDCPAEEQHWRDILLPQCDVVKVWWRLLEMDFEKLIPDLKKLSKLTVAYELDKVDAPLLAFRESYPILHDNIQAKYGLFPSDSRLDEQQHGSLRYNLSDRIGMAQADARQMWLTVTAYAMREARRTGQ